MSFESLPSPPIPFWDLTINLELTLKIPPVSPTRVVGMNEYQGHCHRDDGVEQGNGSQQSKTGINNI